MTNLPAEPYTPRRYLRRHEVARMMQLTPNKFTRRQAGLEARGFPRPVPWSRHPELWDPLEIALWQNAQMTDEARAELGRLMLAPAGDGMGAEMDGDMGAEMDVEAAIARIAGATQD